MGFFDSVVGTARVANCALLIACGARDEELDDVFEVLRDLDVPERKEDLVAQVRTAIVQVRESRG